MSEYIIISGVTVSNDPGQLQDRSAVSVVIREEHMHKPDFEEVHVDQIVYKVVACELLPMMTEYNKQVDYLIALTKQMKEKYSEYKVSPSITLDAGGVGLPVLDLLRERIRKSSESINVYPIRYTGGFFPSDGKKSIKNVPKAEVFQNLMVKMQNGDLEVTDPGKYAAVLREEMRNFKIQYRDSGAATMEAGRGHDDLLCSAANGVYHLSTRRGPYTLNPRIAAELRGALG